MYQGERHERATSPDLKYDGHYGMIVKDKLEEDMFAVEISDDHSQHILYELSETIIYPSTTVLAYELLSPVGLSLLNFIREQWLFFGNWAWSASQISFLRKKKG